MPSIRLTGPPKGNKIPAKTTAVFSGENNIDSAFFHPLETVSPPRKDSSKIGQLVGKRCPPPELPPGKRFFLYVDWFFFLFNGGPIVELSFPGGDWPFDEEKRLGHPSPFVKHKSFAVAFTPNPPSLCPPVDDKRPLYPSSLFFFFLGNLFFFFLFPRGFPLPAEFP